MYMYRPPDSDTSCLQVHVCDVGVVPLLGIRKASSAPRVNEIFRVSLSPTRSIRGPPRTPHGAPGLTMSRRPPGGPSTSGHPPARPSGTRGAPHKTRRTRIYTTDMGDIVRQMYRSRGNGRLWTYGSTKNVTFQPASSRQHPARSSDRDLAASVPKNVKMCGVLRPKAYKGWMR